MSVAAYANQKRKREPPSETGRGQFISRDQS
jgi:hypothetical protein